MTRMRIASTLPGRYWFTVTSLNGSRGSTYGNTTRNSSATTARISLAEPMTLPGTPPGSLRQIQPYTSIPPQPLVIDGGVPLPTGNGVPSSSAWMTIRCRAVNLGWQVVSVSSRRVGVAPGLSGTGAITATSDGSTISRPGKPSAETASALPLGSPTTR